MIKTVIFDMYETLVTMCRSYSYKGANIAADLDLDEKVFREVWDASENDRTLGIRNFEETISHSMNVNDCYSDVLLLNIVRKRKESQKEYFNHLHPEIIPMLRELKKRQVKVALISNCYLEERDTIKQSELWEYFDIACLSCELGVRKPQKEIYEICLAKLGVTANECLYVGDGGSHELDKAKELGMRAVQAAWYLGEGLDQPVGRLSDFEQLESPMDVFSLLSKE